MRWFCILFLGLIIPRANLAQADSQRIYVASPAKPAAIYTGLLDSQTGQISDLQVAASDVNTGFLALHPTLPVLYAATSEKVPAGETNGFVRAYRIQPDTGSLTLLGQAPTHDNGTTHIEVASTGGYVAVCHYSGKGTSLIRLVESGELTQEVATIAHSGASVHPRQKAPHPHGVAISPDAKFVCVADLGNDHVEVFAVSSDFRLESQTPWQAKPGAGPRHVTFHPNGRWLYSINELDSTLSVLEFEPSTGKLTEVETVSTLPADYSGGNSTAEIAITPNGKFLYGSNRGHNSTAAYKIDSDTGRLTFLEHEPTQGDHPRFVGVDRTGGIYLAANMNTNNLVTFHVDQKTGHLKPTGHVAEVARPMCVVFVEK